MNLSHAPSGRRCFAVANVPADDLMKIFMDPHIKTTWDSDVASCEVLGGDGYDKGDGYIVRQVGKFPLMSDREMIWRWIWVKDHPEPGSHTGIVHSVPWDTPPPPKTFRVEAKIANVVVRPLQKDPSKSRVTMFAHVCASWVLVPFVRVLSLAYPLPPWCPAQRPQMDFGLPPFVANFTSSNWYQRNVMKLEAAYKKGMSK